MSKVAQPRIRLGGDAFQQRSGEPRLADAGFTGQQDDLAFAALRFRPAPHQQFRFFFAADQRGEAAAVQRLEAALDRTRSQCREGAHPPGDALEVLRPEVFELEQFADEPARAFGDDCRIRLGDAL